MNILFVCLGNICRSPIAHGIMQQLIVNNNLPWIVDSAGTNGLHIGEAPHQHSTSVCAEHGIDISKQVSRLFIHDDFDFFDKIYVMAKDVWIDVSHVAKTNDDMENVDYFLNTIYPNENKNVTDPWYGNRDGYYAVYNEVEKGCNAIMEQLLAERNKHTLS
jgi:protein-tyrosine phosphatase